MRLQHNISAALIAKHKIVSFNNKNTLQPTIFSVLPPTEL